MILINPHHSMDNNRSRLVYSHYIDNYYLIVFIKLSSCLATTVFYFLSPYNWWSKDSSDTTNRAPTNEISIVKILWQRLLLTTLLVRSIVCIDHFIIERSLECLWSWVKKLRKYEPVLNIFMLGLNVVLYNISIANGHRMLTQYWLQIGLPAKTNNE